MFPFMKIAELQDCRIAERIAERIEERKAKKPR
jgi:hypothetical protein